MYYKWEGIINSAECDNIIVEYKDKECIDGKIGGEEGNKIDLDVRCASIHWVDKDVMLNRTVMSFMTEANEKFFRYNMVGAESIQFGTYKTGGKYDWHMDTVNPLADTIRKLTTIVQLSNPDDYEGGVLQFFNGEKEPEKVDIMKQGSVIVFDSRDYHRLTPVTEGVRYSLTQWSQGDKFI
jgi:PKHD-type hydroxylase